MFFVQCYRYLFYFSLVVVEQWYILWPPSQARKRKLGLLEDEDIANLASAASAQGSEFAQKDAEKENAPLAVAKNHGKNLSLTGDLIGLT